MHTYTYAYIHTCKHAPPPPPTLFPPSQVISFVRPKSPAAQFLKIGDELLSVMGEPVFDLELEDVKSALRALGTTFEARIFRPNDINDEPVPTVAPIAPKTNTSTRRRSSLTKFFVKPIEKNNQDEPPPVVKVYMRNGKPMKCSNSVYCPCCIATREANRSLQVIKHKETVSKRLGRSMRRGQSTRKATLNNPVWDSQA